MMELQSITVKAPGALMLTGEHAVLQQKRATVAAIDRYLYLRLARRSDQKFTIQSTLGEINGDVRNFSVQAPFNFVMQAIQDFIPKLKLGFDLTITSEFSATIGFASSAAVTVATITAFYRLLNIKYSPNKVLQHSIRIVRAVQKVGSGADCAAVTYGGIVLYARDKVLAHTNACLQLSALYCGYKTPTKVVINHVARLAAKFPLEYKKIYQLMDLLSTQAFDAVLEHNLAQLGEIFNLHHGLQDALGTNNLDLAKLVFTLRNQQQIFGAKISGSGLGDCVVGLGHASCQDAINLNTTVGVMICEEN